MDFSENQAETATRLHFMKLKEIQLKLLLYFMNPLEKWIIRRKFPLKLAIQLLKTVFVTFQLCVFATYRSADVNYTYDNKITFSHLFLKDWDSSLEVLSFPPSTGPLAVYKQDTFFEFLDFAINAHTNVQEAAIGSYSYDTLDGVNASIKFCLDRYSNRKTLEFNKALEFNKGTNTSCINISGASPNFSSKEFFLNNNFTISFVNLLEAHLLFTLKTVRFRDLGPFKSPDCFRFDVDITFNNRGHDGQLLVKLEAPITRLQCKASKEFKEDSRLEKFGRSGVNYIVIVLCTSSFFLCCRAIYRARQLKRESIIFFKTMRNCEMTTNDQLKFVNFWYVLIIMNDILIVFGSALKESIENKQLTGDAWNFCSLLLGIGNLFMWMGILRYLGLFRSYNILILTLKHATPDVLRFLLYTILLYAGFTFSGWLILGPYNIKHSRRHRMLCDINGDAVKLLDVIRSSCGD
ncbi:Mucolipin-3 [Orchesella cincta]|uniref:Mucolipin-3 n=1 Tax=Orchesella cincta TaxID=48709 RepID=A0A1D2MC41_ORCCI|nr:Mucolipin-3 [Orchesella cincta]